MSYSRQKRSFVCNDIRWNLDGYPIFIRTIQRGDAAAISDMTATTATPMSFEQVLNSINQKRHAHIPLTVRADNVVIDGPGNYYMVICFDTDQGAAVIGTCALTRMMPTGDLSNPTRTGTARFNMIPHYAEDPAIRDIAMRCLFSCGVSEARNQGLQLDVIRLQIDDADRTTFLDSAVSYFGLDQAVGENAGGYLTYSWDLWKTNWIADNSRFSWQIVQASGARPAV